MKQCKPFLPLLQNSPSTRQEAFYHMGMDLPDISRRLRKVKNLSAFSKRHALSRSTLLRLIDGLQTNPTVSTLRKVDEALRKEKS
jgi:predicted transcriptional regulator